MDKVTLPKRFYKSAALSKETDGWTVTLDTRPLKTPAKSALTLPSEALAAAIAQEWEDQGETLDLQSMALTRLANVVIDRTPTTRADLVSEIVRYAETDVTCYLASDPAELRARQVEGWAPLRHWAGETLGIVLIPVEGLMHSPQPAASLTALEQHVSGLDDWRLTALAWGCSLFGSALLALAVEQGHLTAAQALDLSCIDENYQIELWGRDAEAERAKAVRRRDAEALNTWFKALA